MTLGDDGRPPMKWWATRRGLLTISTVLIVIGIWLMVKGAT